MKTNVKMQSMVTILVSYSSKYLNTTGSKNKQFFYFKLSRM